MTDSDDERKQDILKFVLDQKSVSMYDLMDRYFEKGIDSDTLVSIVYYCAGSDLLEVSPEDGEDGTEVVVSSSPLTAQYLRSTKS